MERKKYAGIDLLRAVACFGIVLMHMAAKSNNSYDISGYFYGTVIPSLTDFVFLFMVISAFGMCCGYKEKMLSGSIDLVSFYKKRYLKILPFFTLLVLFDLIMSLNVNSLCEAVADVSFRTFLKQHLGYRGRLVFGIDFCVLHDFSVFLHTC